MVCRNCKSTMSNDNDICPKCGMPVKSISDDINTSDSNPEYNKVQKISVSLHSILFLPKTSNGNNNQQITETSGVHQLNPTVRVILVLASIFVAWKIFEWVNKPTKWESDYNYNTRATHSTTSKTYSTQKEEIQGITTLLSTTATGVDWLGATKEYKKIWCENSIISWSVMGYDVTKVSADEMLKCIDIYYDDANKLFDKLVDATLDYGIYFGCVVD